MKNKKIRGQVLLAKSLYLSSIVITIAATPGWAIDAAEDAGIFGSITVARQAREGAKALNNGDYAKALNAYKSAINLKGDVPEFYYGLLLAAQKTGAWDQASRALDSISEKEPAAKPHLAFEIGNCYTNTGRYDEAIPMLKKALVTSERDQDFLNNKVKDLIAMTARPAPPVVMSDDQKKALEDQENEAKRRKKEATPPPAIEAVDPNKEEHKGDNYTDAFLKSEWIGIAEYKGYDKKEHILFNDPPIAHYKLIECLIGPPLNPDLPIKFKFNEYDGEAKPQGWKFSTDKMPEKGSRWLIFIPNAVVREGAFDTYRGRYGRQKFTEDNLGEIKAVIEIHHGQ